MATLETEYSNAMVGRKTVRVGEVGSSGLAVWSSDFSCNVTVVFVS